jgi:hypothetical protein
MKKLRLLLLDANVIIQLFKIGIWGRLVEQCDIHLAQSVVGESQFYENDVGERSYISLEQDIASNKISVFDLPISNLIDFKKQFDRIYLDRLDPGECESLAFLCLSDQTYMICSADAIVYRILGNLNRPEQGLSLEEVLTIIGLGRALPRQFTKSFRISNTKQGQQDSIQGKGKLE